MTLVSIVCTLFTGALAIWQTLRVTWLTRRVLAEMRVSALGRAALDHIPENADQRRVFIGKMKEEIDRSNKEIHSRPMEQP
jgi:hypothetical protein